MDHNDKLDGAVSPAFHTTPTSPSRKPSDPTPNSGTSNSGSSLDTSADEDDISVISPPSTLSTQSPAHFVLSNFFFAMSLISLILFIIFSTVTWFTVLRDARSMTDQVLSNATGVSILGHSLQLDPDACELFISWKVLVCGADTTSEDLFWNDIRVPAHCEPFDEALDIYLNDPSKPIFSFAPYNEPMSKSIWDPPKFVSRHSFDKHGKWDPTKDLMVPFQHYSLNAFAFAIDPTMNRSVPIVMFGVLDILGDFLIRSHDAADRNKFTYDSGNGLVTTEVESRLLRVDITRSAVAKAFAISMFFANWALAVGSVYITTLVTFRRLEANSVIAALPFSALLTIPTIRSLYVDSPPLRISIDAVAFFVQIATAVLCSLALLRVLTSRQSPLPLPTGFPV